MSVDEIVRQIVRKATMLKPVEKIILFGSRADGTANPRSDIDIAIDGKTWTDTDINLLKNSLEEELKTPLKFDIVNLNTVQKEGLRKNIFKGRVVYER